MERFVIKRTVNIGSFLSILKMAYGSEVFDCKTLMSFPIKSSACTTSTLNMPIGSGHRSIWRVKSFELQMYHSRTFWDNIWQPYNCINILTSCGMGFFNGMNIWCGITQIREICWIMIFLITLDIPGILAILAKPLDPKFTYKIILDEL